MGTAAVKMKFMPSSPEVDLEDLKESVVKILENEEVKNPGFEEEPIAFGLKAVIATFGWPEEKPLEDLEESFKKIENDQLSNVEVNFGLFLIIKTLKEPHFTILQHTYKYFPLTFAHFPLQKLFRIVKLALGNERQRKIVI